MITRNSLPLAISAYAYNSQSAVTCQKLIELNPKTNLKYLVSIVRRKSIVAVGFIKVNCITHMYVKTVRDIKAFAYNTVDKNFATGIL